MDYKRIGFIGTKAGMNEYQLLSFYNYIFSNQKNIREFHHGDTSGAESQAVHYVKNICQYVTTIAYPPLNHKNRGKIINDITQKPLPYLKRYYNLLSNVDMVIICPKKTEEEAIKTHTCKIINHIKRKHIPYKVIPVVNNEFTITPYYFMIRNKSYIIAASNWWIMYKCNKYSNNNYAFYIITKRLLNASKTVPYVDNDFPTIYTSAQIDTLKTVYEFTEISETDFFIEAL